MNSLHTLEFDVSKYMYEWHGVPCPLPVWRQFEFAVMGPNPKIEHVEYLPPYTFSFTISGKQDPFLNILKENIALAQPCYRRMVFMIIPDRGEVWENWTHGLTFRFGWKQEPYHLIYPKEFKNV